MSWVLETETSEIRDGICLGGREEEGLSRFWKVVKKCSEGSLKAHVQYSIGLVEDLGTMSEYSDIRTEWLRKAYPESEDYSRRSQQSDPYVVIVGQVSQQGYSYGTTYHSRLSSFFHRLRDPRRRNVVRLLTEVRQKFEQPALK